MPTVKQTRRINPLNKNKNVKIGLAFPLDGNNMFGGTETVEDQLKADLLNLLLTQPGERVNEPLFGVGLKYLLFEPEIDGDSLKEVIKEKTQMFVPGITVRKVLTTITDKTLIVQINFEYNYSMEEDNIQLNFNE